MNYFKLIVFLSISFFSCSSPNCDCDLLFKGDDSLVHVSASSNPEVKKLIAKKYQLKEKYHQQLIKHKIESNNKSEEEILKNMIEIKEIEMERQKTELELHRLLRLSTNRKEAQKTIPFTGSCFMLGAGSEVIYEAEYEDGKLISEEWIE